MARREKPPLSPLENAVMRVIWQSERATAEDVRTALAATQPMKDSTVRTILRRLEQKGYATHTVEGRTFVYAPRIESRNVAAEAVRGIIDRFCEGSIENLLVGMVDDEIVSPQKLRQLAERISRAEAAEKKNKTRTKRGQGT
jgi:BlaI family transcriptional regulator, penicillinase repressor